MQIPSLLKSSLFCPGVTAERRAAETAAVVRQALRPALDFNRRGGGMLHLIKRPGGRRRRIVWRAWDQQDKPWRSDVENMPGDLCQCSKWWPRTLTLQTSSVLMHSAGQYLQLTMYVWTVNKAAAGRTHLMPIGPTSAAWAAAVRTSSAWLPSFVLACAAIGAFYSRPQFKIKIEIPNHKSLKKKPNNLHI